ncbi:hypothetical protein As57867_001364, partial [Aphanomyces stellatus]
MRAARSMLTPVANNGSMSMQSLLQAIAQPTFTLDVRGHTLTSADDYSILLDAIQDTEDPSTRSKLAKLALSWLTQPSLSTAQVVGCVHVLATDMWSQIRKDTAAAVARVLPQLPWLHVEAILTDVLQLCKQPSTDDRVDWKALDGAFGVVAALLTQFQKQPPSGFCMGSHSMQYLPAVLLCELKPAVYQAMHHTQLSVRENATAALIHYVALSDAFTQIATFQEVISKLNLYSPHEVLPAAHAEGLLDVAAQLVPHIPLSFLVKHWQVVFPTCEKYVMHVASTVRQKSAGWSLFVCGQTHSNSQDLIGALAQLSIAHTDAIPLLVSILDSLALPCTPHPDVNQRDFFWQRMEGRLMSIECLVQVLGMNRLCWASPYLVQPTKPIRAFQAYAQTVDEYNRYDNVYATDMAPLASWVTGHDDKVARQPAHCILAHVKTPLGRFWHAYVSHAYLCFQSPQYELKRMAAQTLPGLMRLSLWLHDESPSLFPS